MTFQEAQARKAQLAAIKQTGSFKHYLLIVPSNSPYWDEYFQTINPLILHAVEDRIAFQIAKDGQFKLMYWGPMNLIEFVE